MLTRSQQAAEQLGRQRQQRPVMAVAVRAGGCEAALLWLVLLRWLWADSAAAAATNGGCRRLRGCSAQRWQRRSYAAQEELRLSGLRHRPKLASNRYGGILQYGVKWK